MTIQDINEKPKYYYFIEKDGQELKVQRDVQPEKFEDKDVTLYHYQVVDKDGNVVDKYAMSLDEYKANKPTAQRVTLNNMQAMLDNGLTPAELIAKLGLKAG
jgi:hypothetical protein